MAISGARWKHPQMFTWAIGLGFLAVIPYPLFCRLRGRRTMFLASGWIRRSCPQFCEWGGEEFDAASFTIISALLAGFLGGLWGVKHDEDFRSYFVRADQFGLLDSSARWKLWSFYFVHNSRAAGAVLLAGLLGRTLPLIFEAVNYSWLGAMFGGIALLPDVRIGATFFALVPHGLIELPAYLLATITAMSAACQVSGTNQA